MTEQVSRRLARAINASLIIIAAQPPAARDQLQGLLSDLSAASSTGALIAAEAGHVQLAVQTYIHLLGSLNAGDCNIMSQELIRAKPVRSQCLQLQLRFNSNLHV